MSIIPQRPRLPRRAVIASLSASAAALAASSDAEAQIITINVNQNVGFSGGALSTFTLASDPTGVNGLPGASLIFNRSRSSGQGGFYWLKAAFSNAGNGMLRGRSAAGTAFASRVVAGHTYNAVGSIANPAFRLGRAYVSSGISVVNYFGNNTTAIYSAFQFKDSNRGGAFGYGYIKGVFTNTTVSGFTYHIESVTYDSTGALIQTGAVAAVPEPSSLALGALASLVGGAVAVRKWKADRSAAATAAGA